MKKRILFNPSGGYKNTLGDVLPIYNLYKEKFDCYIGLNSLEEEELIEDGIHFLKLHSPKYRYIMYTAEYVFDSGTLSSTWKIMDSALWINLWHGIPIKHMLLDENLSPDKFVNYFRHYDIFVSSSKYYTDIIRDSFLYEGKVLEVGGPRFDQLFLPIEEEVYETLNIDRNKKIIVYAPTFRKRGELEIKFDVDQILNSYGEEVVVVVKAHYLNYLNFKSDNIIDATQYTEINKLLQVADLLITDYSSLIFDYSLLNKKMILFQYDYEEYKEERGMYFDLADYFPNNIAYTTEQLYQKISEKKETEYKLFQEKFLPYENGNSAKRLETELQLNDSEYEMEEIIFLVNQINEIGGVHNFIKTMAEQFKKRKKVKIIMIGINEKNFLNRLDYKFSSEYIDIILSPARSRDAIHKILENTSGTIISTQMWAHIYYQRHMKDKNVILMFHADVKYALGENPLFDWEMKKLANNQLGNYKSLIMLTKNNALNLKEIFSDDRYVSYVENGTNLNENTSPLTGNFIYISRMEKVQKNIFELIKIALELKKMNSSVKIDVFGDGQDKDEFLAEIEKNKLGDILIYKGYSNNPEKEFLNSKCHIMVSVMEGLPYTILESQNVGVPTILYDSFLAASDLIINDYNGILVEEGKYREFASKLDFLEKNPDFLYNMGKNSKKNIEKYEYSIIIDKWIQEFEKLNSLESIEIKTKNTSNNKVIKKFKKIFNIQKKRNFVRDTLSSNYLLYPKKKTKVNMLKFHIRKFFINVWKKTYSYKKKYQKSLILDLKKDMPLEIENMKNYNDLISIIIPSYNSANKISKTLKSILKQTHSNIEVLVMDDGSNDDTKEVVETFRDDRIIYSYHENCGVGLTRNKGIKKAKGAYVFFLDADDTIPKNALKDLLYPAKYYELEIVSGKTFRKHLFNNMNKKNILTNFHNDRQNHFWMKKLYNRFNITNVNENVNIITDTLATNKLYKSNVFSDKNIWFEDVLYEDKLFTIQLYEKVDKIGFINRHVYNWYVYGSNTSITTHKNLENLTRRISTLNKIFDFVENSKIQFKLMDFVFSHDFRIYLNEFKYFEPNEQIEVYNIMIAFLEDKWDLYNLEVIGRGFNYAYALALKEKNRNQFIKMSLIHSESMNN